LKSNILLTGATGNLGKRILTDKKDFSFISPSRKELDITSEISVKKFFTTNSFDSIIHCAALARMKECEDNPAKAFSVNTLGTSNIVNNIKELQKSSNKNIRLIYISTDGVYACDQGNYSEDSPTIPYNIYGWSKLGGEASVKTLENFCIIRTRFFDPNKIPFNESADDIITSSIEINKLVKVIKFLIKDKFKGVLNVGNEASSEFLRYIAHKPNLKKCKRSDIIKNLGFEIARNASMDISLMKKIIKL
jgi:dTDP-4-dehydrorhamnose reductase